MAVIYYDKLLPLSVSATTEAAGFPAFNVTLESLARPYRATNAGANDVTIIFKSVGPLHSIFLHDVNFASCTVQKSVDGVAWVTVGTLTTYVDENGRRRGRITINDASVKGVRIQISAGTPTDGLTFWRIGAAYPMVSTHTVPATLIYPLNEDLIEPATGVELVNKQFAEADTGVAFSKLITAWDRVSTVSLQTLREQAKGTIIFDANLSNYPQWQWPCYRSRSDVIRESFDRFSMSGVVVNLRERV